MQKSLLSLYEVIYPSGQFVVKIADNRIDRMKVNLIIIRRVSYLNNN